jgi:hypothetical protein
LCLVVLYDLPVSIDDDGLAWVVIEKCLVELFAVTQCFFVALIFGDVFCDYDRTARER